MPTTVETPDQNNMDALQAAWAQSLILIGQAYTEQTDYRSLATERLHQCYAFDQPDATILFKPTRAKDQPFRTTFAGTLSYFIGENPDFPEDKGFALQPWINVQFHNHAVNAYGTMQIAMGTYVFTNTQHVELPVEYTLGCIPDDKGRLKIVLHHSSLPFAGG